MMGTIKLRELSYNLKVGVTEEERQSPQYISVDLDIETDITKAITTEDIEDTINYSTIQKTIKKYLENKEYKLIEKLTNDIATMLLQEFSTLKKVSCTCWKPLALKEAKNVGVTIVKSRE
jgi:FolB domain-containing protein